MTLAATTEDGIVSDWMFQAVLQGKTVQEIVESAKAPKPSPDHVRDSIIKAREKFEAACLK